MTLWSWGVLGVRMELQGGAGLVEQAETQGPFHAGPPEWIWAGDEQHQVQADSCLHGRTMFICAQLESWSCSLGLWPLLPRHVQKLLWTRSWRRGAGVSCLNCVAWSSLNLLCSARCSLRSHWSPGASASRIQLPVRGSVGVSSLWGPPALI